MSSKEIKFKIVVEASSTDERALTNTNRLRYLIARIAGTVLWATCSSLEALVTLVNLMIIYFI